MVDRMIDQTYIYAAFLRGELQPFYEKIYPRLLSYATRILGPDNYFMAEDCVQDAVMGMYLRRGDMEDIVQWRAWLMAAVRNNAISRLRKDELNKRYVEHEMLSTDEAEDVYLYGIEEDIYVRIFEVIKGLPQKYRDIFDLSFEQGLKNAEVAAMLNIAEITVKKHKAQLLSILKSKFGRSTDDAMLYALFIIETVLRQ